MTLPPLVHYACVDDYRAHYVRKYCRGRILTADGIHVFFKPDAFGHAFYESTARDGRKDTFSPARAARIDWIGATLEHPQARLLAGWMKQTRSYDHTRRVAVVYGDFVVVIGLRLDAQEMLKANFVTCYQADNSLPKILTSPAWSREACVLALRKEKSR